MLLAAAPRPALAAEVRPIDWLMRARQLYNQEQFDQAIAAAEKAALAPAVADRARLVIGRARLERYRRSADPDELVAGRTTLGRIDAALLPARERVELLLGLGESLYLDNMFGAAANMFWSALGDTVAVDVRNAGLDWWATALDRQAQLLAPDEREPIYTDVANRMETELQRDPSSSAASYWLAAASRGAGDLDRAWDAAMAGWVRTVLAPPSRRPDLRNDLDLLVTTAIIPERARQMAENPSDREKAAAALKAEWDTVKGNWK